MSKNQEILLTNSVVDFLKEEIGGGGTEPLEVSNIESLTNEQCENLKCGDTVIQKSRIGTRSNYKYYVVVAKNDTDMTLVNSSCLVQHLDLDTLIQGNTFRNRRSPYFLDYLNELGISYDDAYTQVNKIKLKELMKEKFRILEK